MEEPSVPAGATAREDVDVAVTIETMVVMPPPAAEVTRVEGVVGVVVVDVDGVVVEEVERMADVVEGVRTVVLVEMEPGGVVEDDRGGGFELGGGGGGLVGGPVGGFEGGNDVV